MACPMSSVATEDSQDGPPLLVGYPLGMRVQLERATWNSTMVDLLDLAHTHCHNSPALGHDDRLEYESESREPEGAIEMISYYPRALCEGCQVAQ